MEPLHHRLAAVWFADVVGYTRQAAADEERALRVVRSFQDAARDVARRYEGRIVKFIGDAVLAEFASTEAAVRAALSLKVACTERALHAGVECPSLRVGVHVGDVATTPDGDVYGDGVNLASRIVDQAEPGEVWVSQDVWRQLRHRPRFEFEERGAHAFQGFEPVDVYAVAAGGQEEAEVRASLGGRARAFLRELQRRHVIRVAAVYAVVGWLVIQIVAATFPTLGLPNGLARTVMLLVILGFPIAVALAWAYEITPQGLRRTGAASGEARTRGRHELLRQAAVAAALAGSAAAWMVFGPKEPTEGEASGEMAVAGGTLEPSRVAVLYFDDQSQDQRLDYLADGITEALINDLAQVRALDIVSREGVKPYRDASVAPDSIGRALGAGTLVEGSITQSGDRVQVRAQLIDAARGTQLTGSSVRIERPRRELFALQDELVQEISRLLRGRLGKEFHLARSRRGTSSQEAWELVQLAGRLRDQAREARDEAVSLSLRREADSLLARSEALDPKWVEPILLRGHLSLDADTPESLRLGLAHAERAANLAPGAYALDLRGAVEHRIARFQSDSLSAARELERAETDLRRAVAADPSLASAWISLADLLYNDKWELGAARDAAKRAYEEDVFLLEEDHFVWLCEISMQLEDFAEAERWCSEGRRRFPGRQRLIMVELYILASEGSPHDPRVAWRLVDALARLPDAEYNVPAAQMVTAAVLARAGLRDSALDVAQRARESAPDDYAALMAYLESYVRLVLGERQTALRLLREFLTALPENRALVARDYWFRALGGDPRFQRLVDSKRLPFFCRILCEPPP